MVRALAVDQIGLFDERFVAHAIQTFVFLLVDIALGRTDAPEFLRGAHVIVVGGTNECVVRQIERVLKFAELGGIVVDIFLDLAAFRSGLLGDLLPMLVGAGTEEYRAAHEAAVAGQNVGLHDLKRKSDMGIGIHIGKCRCYVLGLHTSTLCHGSFPPCKSFTNSCNVAAAGTDRMIPRNPASSAPTMSASITKSGGTPTTRVTTSG